MKRSPLIVIFTTVFIDLVGFGIVIPVLPFYAEGTIFNATPRTVGFLFASYSIMQLIFSPILGRLSDKYGRRPVLLISIIGTGIGFLILGFAQTLFMLFVGRILDGITGGNISTAQAYIADITTKENRAKGMGLVGAAFGLGFIFGPAIGGILSRWGTHVPFFFAGGLCFANAILLYFTLPQTVTKDHPARQSAAGGRTLGQLLQSLKEPRLAFFVTI
jgi:DHA1 family tetracycline resistance protein-like MFS transporter